MTTIATPTPHQTHHLRTALIAVLAALAATAIALGAWALVDTGSDDPATIEPATSPSRAAQMSPREEADMRKAASLGDATELSPEEEALLMREASADSAD